MHCAIPKHRVGLLSLYVTVGCIPYLGIYPTTTEGIHSPYFCYMSIRLIALLEGYQFPCLQWLQ